MEQRVVSQGKTKTILSLDGSNQSRVEVVSKSDITAGNGARRDVIRGKDLRANQVTCDVFELLIRCGVQTAFRGKSRPNAFIADNCEMQPYEIVVRKIADGSFCKRNPDVAKGTQFQNPVREFFLKTAGPQFAGIAVPDDDPQIVEYNEQGVVVAHPGKPLALDQERVHIPAPLIYQKGGMHDFARMGTVAKLVFHILSDAWSDQKCQLIDLKIECGINPRGELVLADVIDADSWRLLSSDGRHLDKQPYRDGATVEDTLRVYTEVADRTRLFKYLPDSFCARYRT